MKYFLRPFALLLPLAVLYGCAGVGYYAQAIGGQMELLSKRRPISDVLADPATPPALREKLVLVRQLRAYASDELKLPDNDSYKTYADLERPYVVWNVFAVPELSVQPREWCFPFAGCVGYRGYFGREPAQAFADALRAAGDDVYVGGVAAYSTLGWLDDPMLNTLIQRPNAELAGILFHELAHQRVYAADDSEFNESFATVVELEGVRRWLNRDGDRRASATAPGVALPPASMQSYAAYEAHRHQREEFAAVMLETRAALATLYASAASVEEKRVAKRTAFAALKARYPELKKRWGNDRYDAWFAQDLNNAHLAAVGTYHRHVTALQKLLAEQGGDLATFYREAERLATLAKAERTAQLERFLSRQN
jgi:predicted aminopeptidase